MSETEGPRRARTRERLLDAAFEVFAEVGLQSATIEQVCEAAGFSRGAFYSNFATKEELFFALIDREHARQHAVMTERMQRLAPMLLADPVDVEAVARTVLEVMQPDGGERHWMLIQREFAAIALRDPEVAVLHADAHRRMVGDISRSVEQAVLAAGRRFVDDPEQVIRTIAWICDGALVNGVIAGRTLREIDEGVTRPIAVLLLAATEPA